MFVTRSGAVSACAGAGVWPLGVSYIVLCSAHALAGDGSVYRAAPRVFSWRARHTWPCWLSTVAPLRVHDPLHCLRRCSPACLERNVCNDRIRKEAFAKVKRFVLSLTAEHDDHAWLGSFTVDKLRQICRLAAAGSLQPLHDEVADYEVCVDGVCSVPAVLGLLCGSRW